MTELPSVPPAEHPRAPGGASFGGQSMIAPLRRVLVRAPGAEFAVDDPAAWGYTARPDPQASREQHASLVALLRVAGAEVLFHDQPLPELADAVFVFDPVLITDEGAIVLRMGKPRRRGEEAALGRRLEQVGIPILHRLSGDAMAEGGDLLWLDRQTLAVGLGFRTNRAGLQQLAGVLSELGIRTRAVELPYHEGPASCLHLLSLISLVDTHTAVVYRRLLSVHFWRFLRDRGMQLLEVPDEEFATMGPNLLALAPRRCIMLQGNPVTEQQLRAAGCEVQTYAGSDISLKAGGGPTCLTLPLLRAPTGHRPRE